MLDKMKQHKKPILIAAVVVVVILIGGGLLAAYLWSGGGESLLAWAFPEFTDNYISSKPTYTSRDPKVTFDGTLDDEAWEGKQWLDVTMETEKSVRVKMTSYFGEDGLYLAFDVDDAGVYYNVLRGPHFNSGIQLYLAAEEGADTMDRAYQIELMPKGKAQVQVYENGNYKETRRPVYCAGNFKGELNSPQCRGYTMEAFFSYSMLDDAAEAMYANPAIIRTFSSEFDDYERTWYWFGGEINGASWTNATTWWYFNKDGLVGYDVSLTGDENGKLEGKDFVPFGEDYTCEIVPNEGYYAGTLTVNGKDVLKDVTYKKGKTYYTIEQPKEALDIVASFAKLPEGAVTISGTINDGTNAVKGASAWAVLNGFSQQLALDENGNYSASVPAVEGLKIFAEADGYVSGISSVPKNGGTVNVVLRKPFFGVNQSVNQGSENTNDWDLTRLYENRVRLRTPGSQVIMMNSEIYSNSILASANLVTEMVSGKDTRTGFCFYDADGNRVYLALSMMGEVKDDNPNGDISCSLQVISVNKDGKYSWGSSGMLVPISDEKTIMKLAGSEEGVPMSVRYFNGAFDVWINGEQVAFDVKATDPDGKDVLSAGAKAAVGLECWNGKSVYNQLTFDGNYPAKDPNSVSGWDLSKLDQGIVRSLSDFWMTKAMLTNEYKNEMSISARIPLPLVSGKDTRAGFTFENQRGDDVFIALTMNGEKDNITFYNVQIISKNFSKWDFSGMITDITLWGDIRAAANSSEGVDVSVYVKDGKFTIGIGGYLVAEDVYAKDAETDKNIFEGDTALKCGLETAGQKVTFTNVALGSTKPDFEKSLIGSEWDLSKIDQGEVHLTKANWESPAMLWRTLRDKYYITSKVVLTPESKDIRSGYRLVDKDGNVAFICLYCDKDNNYSVQTIYRTATGGFNWGWCSAPLDESYGISNAAKGIPFAVSYENGKVSIWVNNKQVAGEVTWDIDGNKLFPAGTKVSVGLECWDYEGTFYQLAAYNKRPK